MANLRGGDSSRLEKGPGVDPSTLKRGDTGTREVTPEVQRQFTEIRRGFRGSRRQSAGPTRQDLEAAQAAALKEAEQQAAREALLDQLVGRPTQKSLRQRVRESQGRQERAGGRQTGSVTRAPERSLRERVRDIPARISERITGEKPAETLQRVTGQERDITEPVTVFSAASDISTLPISAIRAAGLGAGLVAEKATEQIPESIGRSEVTVFEPVFGTPTTPDQRRVTERQVEVDVLTPSGVRQVAEVGTQLALFGATPAAFVAPGFILPGTERALDKERPTSERLLGGAEAALGAALLAPSALRGLKRLRGERLEAIPLRPAREPVAVEVQRVGQVAGEPTTLATFKITGEVAPPVKIVRTTRLQRALGLEGKTIKVKPGRQFEIFTPEVIVGDKPFIVAEQISGQRFATLSQIKGDAIPRTLEEIRKLPKVEQYLWKQMAEQVAGRPVAAKLVPEILKQNSQKVTSFIKAEKVVKIRQRPSLTELKGIPPGRRQTQFLGVTEEVPLATGAAGEARKQVTLFKDITFPGARAAGKPRKLETIIIRTAEDTGPLGTKIKPADITKTPFESTFGPLKTQQETLISKAAQVPIPKVRPTPKPTTPRAPQVSKLEDLVFGTPSAFAGTAMFERTDQASVGRLGQQPSQVDGLGLAVSPVVSSVLDSKVSQVTDILQPEVQIDKVGTTQLQPQTQAQPQPQLLGQAPVQLLQTQQELREETIFGTRGRQPSRARTPTPKGKITTETELKKKRAKQPARFFEQPGWIPEVKERGKWKPVVDEALEKEQAEALAKIAADKTLAASARIKESNKPASSLFQRLIANDEKFRDFARRKGVEVPLDNTWIERRKHRLDSPKEKQDLQAFKRSAQFKGLLRNDGGTFGFGGSRKSSQFNLFGSGSRTKRKSQKTKSRNKSGIDWFS